jgi:hypothetical protein
MPAFQKSEKMCKYIVLLYSYNYCHTTLDFIFILKLCDIIYSQSIILGTYNHKYMNFDVSLLPLIISLNYMSLFGWLRLR